jgi:hypothetical protein
MAIKLWYLLFNIYYPTSGTPVLADTAAPDI